MIAVVVAPCSEIRSHLRLAGLRDHVLRQVGRLCCDEHGPRAGRITIVQLEGEEADVVIDLCCDAFVDQVRATLMMRSRRTCLVDGC